MFSQNGPTWNPTNGHPLVNNKQNVEKHVSKCFCREFVGLRICGKTAEEAGSELVAIFYEDLYKVKQALLSQSITDKTLKEEAVYAVSEMDSLLNKHRCLFLGPECTLKNITNNSREGKDTHVL